MGRTAWGARGCAAVALMACCLTVTASAQQASAPPPPAGSTSAVPAELPISVERVRDHLSREPAIRLDSQPIFRLEVNEWRPRYWDLQSPFFFEVGPRDSTTQWHNEFLAMTTPDEARMYGPMQSSGETAQLVATGMLFAGAAKLVTAGVNRWRDGRREGKARAARAEVDAALAALEAVNQGAGARPD